MRITFKTFWCERCGGPVAFRRPGTEIVQAQADHFWEEHGIDIREQVEVATPRPVSSPTKGRALRSRA